MHRPFPAARALVMLALVALPRIGAASWPTDPNANLAITAAPGLQRAPNIATDGAGGIYVTWQDLRAPVEDVYVQHVLSSGTIAPGWPVNGLAPLPVDSARVSPVIVADGSGGSIVAWQDRHAGNADVAAQHVLSNGTADPAWPAAGRFLCTDPAEQQSPRIVSDGAGGAIVAWSDTRNLATTGYDIFAQHVLANGTVDPAWPVNGRAVCTATGTQLASAIVADGAGGAVLAWEDGRGVNVAVFAQHLQANGAVDPTWPSNGRALTSALAGEIGPTIVSDQAGGAIVTWMDFRNGDPDIFAQHVLAGGAVDPVWPPDGRAVCTAFRAQYYPVIASDGLGGAVLAWWDLRSDDGSFTNSDVYAHHLLANGSKDPNWPIDGRAVCTAAGLQFGPAIVTDGAGGGIVVWSDQRAGAASDIYAQHILPIGVTDPDWPVDGSAVCTAPLLQQGSVLIDDGAGGAIIAWEDFRNDDGQRTNVDIYAQRIQANGVLGGGGNPPPQCITVPFDFKPDDLDLKSNGKWVTGTLRPASPYTAAQIDVGSLRLNQVVTATSPKLEDHNSKLKVKFSRQDLKPTLTPGDHVPVTVTGTIAATCFTGTDYIKVKAPKIHKPDADSRLVAGATTVVTWDADPIVQTASMLSSTDGGVTWNVEVASLPNTGSYTWTVSPKLIGLTSLEIVTIDGTDETGVVDGSEIAVSDPFVVLGATAVGDDGAAFALRPASNPATGPLQVRLSLPSRAPAALIVLDVAGRAVMSREVGTLGPGAHTVRLGALPVGVYVVRLSQAGRSLSARVAVLR